MVIEKSFHFNFKKSNNEAEYEALIVSLNLSKEVGVQGLICWTYFKLTMGQIIGEYQVKDAFLLQYYHLVCNMIDSFPEVKLEHVPKANNMRANVLSKLTNTKAKWRSSPCYSRY